MQNPLYAGLVAYALATSQTSHVGHFQPRLLELVKDLKMTEDWDELSWYARVYQSWSNQVEPTALIDLLVEFRQLLRRIEIEQLIAFGLAIRQELIVAQAPSLQYRVKTVFATYTVQWEDGLQVEYNCRPFGLESGRVDLPFLQHLLAMFGDQFLEAAVTEPGLDAYHDQVAKPFDPEKFQELLKVMEAHVNAMAAAEREAYQHILIRVRHQFGPGPQVKLPREQPLEFIPGDGGFQ
jgi:hypothetical protein